MKKINFIIPKCNKEKVTKVIEYFENISYRFLNETVNFEIFSDKVFDALLTVDCINTSASIV